MLTTRAVLPTTRSPRTVGAGRLVSRVGDGQRRAALRELIGRVQVGPTRASWRDRFRHRRRLEPDYCLGDDSAAPAGWLPGLPPRDCPAESADDKPVDPERDGPGHAQAQADPPLTVRSIDRADDEGDRTDGPDDSRYEPESPMGPRWVSVPWSVHGDSVSDRIGLVNGAGRCCVLRAL